MSYEDFDGPDENGVQWADRSIEVVANVFTVAEVPVAEPYHDMAFLQTGLRSDGLIFLPPGTQLVPGDRLRFVKGFFNPIDAMLERIDRTGAAEVKIVNVDPDSGEVSWDPPTPEQRP